MDMVRKQITAEPEAIGERVIRFCISNELEDRDGDVLIATGCDFTNFAKNPQFLGFHNYWDFPLGKPTKWWIDSRQKKVYAEVYFPTLEELATDPQCASEKAKLVDTTYNMFKVGMLNAVSIGFRIKEANKNDQSSTPWGQIITKWELIEFSAVPVPANPEALAEVRKSFTPEIVALFIDEEKGAIPYHKYPLADEDDSWDGPKEVASAEVSDLAKMCAWKASGKKPEDMTKADFKLPHHTADGYKTVKKGVIAAMGALKGARGGVNIPEADIDAVYSHLAKHYEEFDLEPPEKSIKSGRRISSATQAIIDEAKGCHENIKAIHGDVLKAMKALSKEHEVLDGIMHRLEVGDDETVLPEDEEDILDIED